MKKDDGFYQSCAHWFDMNTLIFHSYHHLMIIYSILILHFAFFHYHCLSVSLYGLYFNDSARNGYKRKLDDSMKYFNSLIRDKNFMFNINQIFISMPLKNRYTNIINTFNLIDSTTYKKININFDVECFAKLQYTYHNVQIK